MGEFKEIKRFFLSTLNRVFLLALNRDEVTHKFLLSAMLRVSDFITKSDKLCHVG